MFQTDIQVFPEGHGERCGRLWRLIGPVTVEEPSGYVYEYLFTPLALQVEAYDELGGAYLERLLEERPL